MSDATASDPILYGVDGHVATITTNRPERYNSLNYEAYRLLTEYFAQADADPQVRAIIWTGSGRGFCTGADVKELHGAGADELARRIASGELELPSGPMLRSETPIIAAVNGPAVGYGMELALLADIRVASTQARFSEMFVKRAIVAGHDSFELLPRIVGPAAAAELLLPGRPRRRARCRRRGPSRTDRRQRPDGGQRRQAGSAPVTRRQGRRAALLPRAHPRPPARQQRPPGERRRLPRAPRPRLHGQLRRARREHEWRRRRQRVRTKQSRRAIMEMSLLLSVLSRGRYSAR